MSLRRLLSCSFRFTVPALFVAAATWGTGCTGHSGLSRRQLDSIELEKETFAIFVKDSGSNPYEATREAILIVDSCDRSTAAFKTCSTWLLRKGVDTAQFKATWAAARKQRTDSATKEAERRYNAGQR